MRKKETLKHKVAVRRRYERIRQKANILLKHRHEKEYKKIIKKLLKGGIKK